MGDVSEPSQHCEQDVLGSGSRAEGAELPDGVVPTPNSIEEPVTHEPRQQIPRGRWRSTQTSRSLDCCELRQPFANELIEESKP